MSVFDTLKERGYLAQVTHEEELKKALETEQVTFYMGFDPTADSLHVGHFLALMAMSHMQKAGHRPICLVGGGTGTVGDPSGRTDMRKMLTDEDIEHNCNCFKKQMERFIDFSDGKALMINNGDWLRKLNYIELLRDVGPHFSVNRMLTAECYKQRLERGLTFLEFNYMIMQAYDFMELNRRYGCVLELGGDDQWSNIIAGVELIRRKEAKPSYGMTFNLLTNSEGKKMGKTAKGALWLDPEKTSPYEFYQYWRNVGDADVIKCLKMLTFVPIEEIEEMEKHMEGAEYNKAKELLAYELTKLVHGKEEADKADAAAKAIFAGGGNSDDMPSTTIAAADLTDGKIGILTLLVKCGLCPSNGEARRLVTQNGIAVNGEKFTDPKGLVDLSEPVVIKKGKKIFHKAIAE